MQSENRELASMLEFFIWFFGKEKGWLFIFEFNEYIANFKMDEGEDRNNIQYDNIVINWS